VDVEETIKFILESQAKAEIRQAKAENRMSAMEKRLDKRMDGVAKSLKPGMRILVKHQAETRSNINALVKAQMRSEARAERLDGRMEELAASHKGLAASQKDTQRTPKAFIESLKKGRNGH
jgi:phage-related tail protein